MNALSIEELPNPLAGIMSTSRTPYGDSKSTQVPFCNIESSLNRKDHQYRESREESFPELETPVPLNNPTLLDDDKMLLLAHYPPSTTDGLTSQDEADDFFEIDEKIRTLVEEHTSANEARLRTEDYRIFYINNRQPLDLGKRRDFFLFDARTRKTHMEFTNAVLNRCADIFNRLFFLNALKGVKVEWGPDLLNDRARSLVHHSGAVNSVIRLQSRMELVDERNNVDLILGSLLFKMARM
ncbi:hypothetical protein M501DRAFT_993227 [Patellaria atrata CBS 101060]|uniref:Uncharacterized protein n=1 Tax=Patellaria atrata CBS 101060 TaxID=1346257 RepID=A0A9P4VR22_9PEZI|nr:hypothetical protein M501DRAFT_993227 [Patellaria atrata CBS 101060]